MHCRWETGLAGLAEVEARHRKAVVDKRHRRPRLGAGPPRPAMYPDDQRRRPHAGWHIEIEPELLPVNRRVDDVLVGWRSLGERRHPAQPCPCRHQQQHRRYAPSIRSRLLSSADSMSVAHCADILRVPANPAPKGLCKPSHARARGAKSGQHHRVTTRSASIRAQKSLGIADFYRLAGQQVSVDVSL